MIVKIDEFYMEFYAQGHLEYTLTSMQRFVTVKAWQEWLQTEPIAYFNNTEDWTMEDGLITYAHQTDEEEAYNITMHIKVGQDIVLHSAEASQSMFFKVCEEDKLELIYVD